MTDRTPPRRRLTRLLLAAFTAAWLALVAVPPVVFMRWRDARLGELSASPAQAEWDTHDDAKRRWDCRSNRQEH